MTILKKKLDANQYNLKDQVVAINRVTKVVKGGKNMSFAALVVVGDAASGVVGHGSGKAKEVPQAIRKGIEAAKKNLVRVNLTETTIPHLVLGRYRLRPGAAEAGAGRHGRDCRRRGARGDDLGRSAERAHQEPRFSQPAQRGQGHLRRAGAVARPGRCGHHARQDRGGDVSHGGDQDNKMIRIQYYRSKNSTPAKHKAVVKGLGFTRLNQIVERVDTESTRGMVKAVPHLVRILEN